MIQPTSFTSLLSSLLVLGLAAGAWGCNSPSSQSQQNTAAEQAAATAQTTPIPGESPTAAQSESTQLLYDFRTDVAQPSVSTAEETKVISALTSGTTWDKSCQELTVQGAAKGSFTATQQQETAYLAYVSFKPGCPNTEASSTGLQAGTSYIAIFSAAGEPLTRVKAGDYQLLLSAADTNQDGISELLLGSGLTNMGISTTRAALATVAKGELQDLNDLGFVYYNSCGANQKDTEVIASVLQLRSVQPNRPSVQKDNYKAACIESGNPNPEAFDYISSGKFPKEI